MEKVNMAKDKVKEAANKGLDKVLGAVKGGTKFLKELKVSTHTTQRKPPHLTLRNFP
jgi:hypothetical protein